MIRRNDTGALSRDVVDAVKFDLEGQTTKPPDEGREEVDQKSHHLRVVTCSELEVESLNNAV